MKEQIYKKQLSKTNWIFDNIKKKELTVDKIRISCACIARIVLEDGKFLLIQNKKQRNQGNITYGPIGGALEYNEEALDFLMSIDAEFEKGSDLRIHIPAEHFETYKAWFLSKVDRETSIFREMYEEMVDEEHFISALTQEEFVEEYSNVVETTMDWEINGETKTTYYFFEVYDVKFNQSVENVILENLKSDESLRLFTTEEIETLQLVAGHSKFLSKNF